jgi:hypothetical protein
MRRSTGTPPWSVGAGLHSDEEKPSDQLVFATQPLVAACCKADCTKTAPPAVPQWLPSCLDTCSAAQEPGFCCSGRTAHSSAGPIVQFWVSKLSSRVLLSRGFLLARGARAIQGYSSLCDGARDTEVTWAAVCRIYLILGAAFARSVIGDSMASVVWIHDTRPALMNGRGCFRPTGPLSTSLSMWSLCRV